MRDWDDYWNGTYIPGSEAFLSFWPETATRYRTTLHEHRREHAA
jgi:hypothetical protein